jgi:large subunit ribosomal protein L31
VGSSRSSRRVRDYGGNYFCPCGKNGGKVILEAVLPHLEGKKMKQEIHPEYKEVVFLDMSTGKKFLCRSAVKTHETVEFEGKSYPCMKVSISSDSHPFYTGDKTFVDTEGRVDKFKKRYAKAAEPVAKVVVEEVAEEPKKEAKKAAKAVKAAPAAKAAKEAPAAKIKAASAKKAPAKK